MSYQPKNTYKNSNYTLNLSNITEDKTHFVPYYIYLLTNYMNQ